MLQSSEPRIFRESRNYKQPSDVFYKKLQHRCFPVKFANSLNIPILRNICELLLLKECYKQLVTRVKVRKIPLAGGLWTNGRERRVSSIFNTESEYATVRSISHYIQLPQMSDIYVSFKFLISRKEAPLITFQCDRVHFWCRTIPSAGTFTEMEILRGLFFSTFL